MIEKPKNNTCRKVNKRWWDCNTTGNTTVIDKQFTDFKWAKSEEEKYFYLKFSIKYKKKHDYKKMIQK